MQYIFSVVERAAQQLSVERWDQAARHPPPGRSAGGQPTENVDLREVFLRSDQNPLKEETPLFLHEQDERTQSLSGQDRKTGEPRGVASRADRGRQSTSGNFLFCTLLNSILSKENFFLFGSTIPLFCLKNLDQPILGQPFYGYLILSNLNKIQLTGEEQKIVDETFT